MRIEYAQAAKMSQNGSSLLRAIQNNSTPVLDLLVRESIQNSLDAGVDGTEYVKVNFITGEFDSHTLSNEFEGIDVRLAKKYPGVNRFISIEDTNTYGLSGPLCYDEIIEQDYGNLIKLVYEISKPQEKEGAGGSWGLGKTVYFRVGIGLVIYYSRVKLADGNYQSRLAACLVEDEKKSDALLKRPNKHIERGIAWWGQLRKEGATETYPLTDEREIRNLLDIFGVKEFKAHQTGSKVIIPYVSEDKLLLEVEQGFASEDSIKPFWTATIEDYLRVSIQKWYAPRIENPRYQYGAFLKVAVNETSIHPKKFYPCFQIIQELYNCAISRTIDFDYMPNLKATIKGVELRKVFGVNGQAGTLAHIKVSKDDLKMKPPYNYYDPYSFLSLINHSENGNPIIMGFTRKPGMVVSYEIMGSWTDNTPKSEPGYFVLAFFVLNSDNTVLHHNKDLTLEEYVRRGEQADHTSWSDSTLSGGSPLIVTKIQSQIRKNLSEQYRKDDESSAFIEDRGIGREFAKLLLPPTGYGSGSSSKPKPGNPGGKGAKKNMIAISPKPRFKDGNAVFDFNVQIIKPIREFDIVIKAMTENMGLSADDWEKEDSIGNQFPMKLKALRLESIAFDEHKVNNLPLLTEGETSILPTTKISFLSTKVYKQRYGVRFSTLEDHKKISMSGAIICKIYDPQMRITFDLLEDTKND